MFRNETQKHETRHNATSPCALSRNAQRSRILKFHLRRRWRFWMENHVRQGRILKEGRLMPENKDPKPSKSYIGWTCRKCAGPVAGPYAKCDNCGDKPERTK